MCPQKDPCDNSFKAVDQANTTRNAAKDVTGIVGHACGRHGCYVPQSIVDLQKGERQANVDWSLMGALDGMNADPSQPIFHIYDIACQYHKHLSRRFESSQLLRKDVLQRIIHTAIGSFHVHGHKDTCYFRYSTLYVPGVGIIDGEILETLWSVLNEISRSIRTATLAHRAEVLDDHMNDSNWKKLVTVGE